MHCTRDAFFDQKNYKLNHQHLLKKVLLKVVIHTMTEVMEYFDRPVLEQIIFNLGKILRCEAHLVYSSIVRQPSV